MDNFSVIDIKTGFEMLPHTAIQEAAYEHIYEETLKDGNPQLEFNEADHTYKLNGVTVPAVTKILQVTTIVDLSSIPLYRLEPARAFGEAVHKTCELFDKHILDERSLDSNLWPYLDGWVAFVKDYKLTFKNIEQPIGSKIYRVAGTPDRISSSEKRHRLAVLLTPEGNYKVTEYKDKNDWQVFLAALSVYNWKARH